MEHITFSVEMDDRTAEERKKDDAIRKQNKAAVPKSMDTKLPKELGNVPSQIRVNPNFFNEIQGRSPKPDQHRKFDRDYLFSAVSSGEVTKLEGLEEYLKSRTMKLTSVDYMPDGKTVLMKALLNLKNGDNQTVKLLLGIAERNNRLEELVNAKRTDSSYEGQTALHIAIERRNKQFVELLIEKGADVHAKACGTFFQPISKKCFYFGELPLSLAACTNQKDIVDLLMNKADVRYKDTLGNTVLHALIMVAEEKNTDFVISMYDHILTKDADMNPTMEKLEDITNTQGLTPIKLAATLGKTVLLEHILHREFQQEKYRRLSRRFTEWAYGPVYGLLFDLGSLDTYEPNSVLEIVVYGREIPNRLELLQIEPLNQLLEDKWNNFAKWIYLFKFIVYIIYLVIFTAVSYYREEGTPPFPVKQNPAGYLLVTGQVMMVIGSLYFLVAGLVDLNKKRPSLQTLLDDGYSDVLFLLQAVLFIICAWLYLTGNPQYLAYLVVSLSMCWVNLLYFSRGFRYMGIYNIMIQKIFLRDILRFLCVYMVFLIGFSAAVVTLLKEPSKGILDIDNRNVTEGCKKPTFKSISFTTLELFKFTIGMGDLEFTEDYESIQVFYVLLIAYIVLTYILLLNLLIALMSKTADDMHEKSIRIWKLQHAITILDLERFACCLKIKPDSRVKSNLGITEEDWRCCLRVEEAQWDNWHRNMDIMTEDPGECSKVAHKESSQSEDSQQGSEPHTVLAGEEIQPLTSSSL